MFRVSGTVRKGSKTVIYRHHFLFRCSLSLNLVVGNMNSYGICDDEWILRKTEGTYFLRVGDFASKVYWPVGTFLDSKVFLIGNTKFKLRFFPNCVYPSKKVLSNDGENNEIENFEENFVGVYIYNESNFDVLADIKLTLGPRTMALQKQFLRERECVGEFGDHEAKVVLQ